MNEQVETVWTVVSGFGHNTQQPFVEVIVRPQEIVTQMSPESARELAINLLAAADAAESDAFLVSFVRDRIGADERSAAGILFDFREWRNAHADRVEK